MIIRLNKNIISIDQFKLKCSIGKGGIGKKLKEGDKITPKGGYYLDKLYYRKDEVINKIVQEWERSVDGLLEEELNVGKFATTKWFAYAEIYDFAVSNQEEIKRRKASLKNTTMVGIQVRLVNVETGRYITGSGLGTSAKEGEGLLKNLDMSFDQSTVSFATTGAVITAVANVLRRLEKRGW